MSDKIEKLLKETQEQFRSQSIERTADCPSDMDLHMLCFEEEEDGPLKSSLMAHIVLCPYCSDYVLHVIRNKIRSAESLSTINNRLFPLPEEIDWGSIKGIELFKDNIGISRREAISLDTELEFEIHEPGFYHIAIDTGQVLWRREIERKDIVLTDQERKRTLDYGMAAGTDKGEERITGFEKSYWDGRLKVTLVKRTSRGKLVLSFIHEEIQRDIAHLNELRKEFAMPSVGDTMKAWCGQCERETTWVVKRLTLLQENPVWQCMGCGKVRS